MKTVFTQPSEETRK